MAQDIFTASGSWEAPAGVTSVDVECWGAGACGGSGETRKGGGGGAYSKKLSISVTPGNSYTVVVGQSGTPVKNAEGANGGDSYFIDVSTVLAKGGGGNGIGGQASSGVGDIKYSGGNGKTTTTNEFGGGGGAGDSANGTSSSSIYGGAGGSNYGGAGGRFNGFAGSNLGGGGGVAHLSTVFGGLGGRGEVRINYSDVTAPTVTTPHRRSHSHGNPRRH